MRQKKWQVVILAVLLLITMLAAPITAAPGQGVERADYLVGFRGSPNRGLVERFGGEVYAEFVYVKAIAVRLPPQAAEALEKNPMIAYVEPDAEVYALAQTEPWGIDRVFGDENQRASTWAVTTGSGIGVAVLDTGIDSTHEDLIVAGGTRFYIEDNEVLEDGNYQDGHGHGTHVAGTIAALDNDLGVVGVAPNVSLYGVKVLSDAGSGSTSAIIKGIEWVINNNNNEEKIQIINMSLGSGNYSAAFEQACKNAFDAGILVVAAAGNSGNRGGGGDTVGYPAKYASVIAVAASDSNSQRASFSSTGPDVELIAPGVSIESTIPDDQYASYNGTSMASPHVAGVAALVWEANPYLDNAGVRAILNGNTQNLGLSFNHQGNGLVRADLAVAKALETAPTIAYSLSLTVNPENAGSVNGGGVYAEGEKVNITATANESYNFVNWTEGKSIEISNEANFTYTMPGKDVTITANFSEEETPTGNIYTLDISSSEGGSVTLPGEETYEYDEGTVVELKALPVEGYQFVNWTGNTAELANATSAETTITMNGSYSITANFKEYTAPPSVETVSVDSITYTISGGRNQDRHLHVTLALKDVSGNAVSGASVSIDLERENSTVFAASGTTDSNGTVTLSYNNAPSGTYTTNVTDVTAAGFIWDGINPPNTYNK